MYIERENGKITVGGPWKLELALSLIIAPAVLFEVTQVNAEEKRLSELVMPYMLTFGPPDKQCQTIVEIKTIKCLVTPEGGFREAIQRMESNYPEAVLTDSRDGTPEHDWWSRSYKFPGKDIKILISRMPDETAGVHIELQSQ